MNSYIKFFTGVFSVSQLSEFYIPAVAAHWRARPLLRIRYGKARPRLRLRYGLRESSAVPSPALPGNWPCAPPRTRGQWCGRPHREPGLQRFEAKAVGVLIHRNFVILAMLIDDMLTPR